MVSLDGLVSHALDPSRGVLCIYMMKQKEKSHMVSLDGWFLML